jgi:hypothetical protein
MKTAKELQEAIAAAAHEIGHCCVAMEEATVAYEHSLEEHGHLLEELVGMVPADPPASPYTRLPYESNEEFWARINKAGIFRENRSEEKVVGDTNTMPCSRCGGLQLMCAQCARAEER